MRLDEATHREVVTYQVGDGTARDQIVRLTRNDQIQSMAVDVG